MNGKYIVLRQLRVAFTSFLLSSLSNRGIECVKYSVYSAIVGRIPMFDKLFLKKSCLKI